MSVFTLPEPSLATKRIWLYDRHNHSLPNFKLPVPNYLKPKTAPLVTDQRKHLLVISFSWPFIVTGLRCQAGNRYGIETIVQCVGTGI